MCVCVRFLRNTLVKVSIVSAGCNTVSRTETQSFHSIFVHNPPSVSSLCPLSSVLRPQAYTSVSKASLGIADHKELGKMMNTIIFHTKMVDSLVEMLVETSDLSIFW